MTEYAYAKINLSLDVVCRRDDGYHDVNMIMQSLELNDTVEAELTDGGIEVTCDSVSVPGGKSNIAYRAARLMIDKCGRDCGVRIHIKKRIPVCAGLAGGSADGAAVIRLMNALLGANFDSATLESVAAAVGSDVPFCINGGTALAFGTGTQIKSLPSFGSHIVLLVKPPIDVPTPWVYKNLKLGEVVHPDIDGFISALERNDADSALATSGNVLESVTISKYPIIENIKSEMINNGAKFAMMSGSGPTVFGIFENKCDAENAARFFKKSYDEVIVTKTV